MKHAALVLTAVVAIHPANGRAAVNDPRILAPASPWTLDFADERCSLIREFGDGDDKLRLQIDSFGPSPGYRVMISGEPVPQPFNVPILEIRVGYSPDTVERRQFYASAGRFGTDYAVSFRLGFRPDQSTAVQTQSASLQTPGETSEADRLNSEFARSVTHMTVQFDLRTPLRLDTGSMAAPFAAMDECVDNLIASWGIDPAQHRTRSRPPQLLELPENYVRVVPAAQIDYPSATERRLSRNAEAMSRAGELLPVRVMIDAAGQATACVVQVDFASEARRQSVCELLSGPYQPALDSEGQPIASFVQYDTR